MTDTDTPWSHADRILKSAPGTALLVCAPASGVNMNEGGTIHYKPGDVVRLVDAAGDGEANRYNEGREWTCYEKHPKGYHNGPCVIYKNEDGRLGGWMPCDDKDWRFEVVSRAERAPVGHLLADLDPQDGDVVRLVQRPEHDGWGYPAVGDECPIADGYWFGVNKDYWHELEGRFEVVSRAERKPVGHLLADLDLQPGDVVRCVGGGERSPYGFTVSENYEVFATSSQPHGLRLNGVSRHLFHEDKMSWRFEVVSRAERPAPVEKPVGLRLEAGKYYQTRDGRKIGPMQRWSTHVDHCWEQAGGSEHYAGQDVWRRDGSSHYFNENGWLVSEWTESAPVEKPETVWVYAVLYDDGSMGDPTADKRAAVRASKDSAFHDTNNIIRWQAEVVPLDD
jgi:hypothetical protein